MKIKTWEAKLKKLSEAELEKIYNAVSDLNSIPIVKKEFCDPTWLSMLGEMAKSEMLGRK